MVLIFGLLGMAVAAVAAFTKMTSLEPTLAGGVTNTVKQGVIQSIVSGIATVICSLLGVRSSGQRIGSSGRFTQRAIDLDD